MVELLEAEIETYLALDQRRKKAQREADNLERELKPLKTKIKAYVEEKGGSDRTTVHYGYVLAMLPRGGRVEWKNEYIAIAGAQAAIEKQANCPPTFLLNVEPAGSL